MPKGLSPYRQTDKPCVPQPLLMLYASLANYPEVAGIKPADDDAPNAQRAFHSSNQNLALSVWHLAMH
jgi:hypothetical protein